MLWLGVHLAQFPAGFSWDAQSETDALSRLAGWAGRFTPIVSLAPPRELLLEVEGSLRLFGGPDRIVEQVEQGLKGLGYAFATAIAPTPLAAVLLARAAPGTRLADRRRLEPELARVPVGVLDLAPETSSALRGIGAGTVGDCLKLPRAGLTRRVGPDLMRALDRALGRIPDPRAPFVPPARYEGSVALPAPVNSVEPLLFAARRLLLELEGYLEARGGGAVALGWTLRHHRESSTRVDVGLAAPARDPGRLLKLLRERLERTRLAGPVESVTLAVEGIRPLAPAHLDLWTARESPPEQAWPELLDRLRARLGGGAVQGLRLAADHRPERAFVRTEPAPGEDATQQPDPAPRPLWLLPEPELLRGMVHWNAGYGKSQGLKPGWRGGGGSGARFEHKKKCQPCTSGTRSDRGPNETMSSHRISRKSARQRMVESEDGPRRQDPGAFPLTLIAGPERIETGWWDGEDVRRDYFVAEDRSGLRLWVFRERDGERRWFLHGIFG